MSLVVGLSVLAVALPAPLGPVFGPSYVVTDVQTLQGLTIDGLVPQPYVVGTYVSGGDTASYGYSDPCPLGSYYQFPGDPGPGASVIDYQWIHQFGNQAPVVWDLGSPHGAVFTFPSADHGPFPEEGIEYTVWGSANATAPFPDGWTLATLSAIYTKGWIDDPNCPNVESDDWAAEYTFGFQTFRFIALYASNSITIFLNPAHSSWSGPGDDHPWAGWQSNDMEIDGVGAPVCAPGSPAGDAGPDQVVPVGTTVHFDGTGSTGDVALYGWDSDGNSVIDLTGPSPSKTYTAPFDGIVRLTVVDDHGCGDSDSMRLQVVSNRAPTIASFVATPASEGDPVTFIVAATDPDGDALTYAFDFESDGTFDASGTSNAASHVFGDDVAGTATVRVSDGKVSVDAQASVLVTNVAPSVTAEITATTVADVTLRVAGEKWHDVSLSLMDGATTTVVASVVRRPGSPDDQAATVADVAIDVLGADSGFVVTYTPADDPVNGRTNGANPAWVIFRAADGRTVSLHHTFNVRHPDTWTWRVSDLRVLLAGFPIEFAATAHDPGSDDLTFTWSWGDGTPDSSTTVFNDGASADPYPSPAVNPITAATAETHAFAAGTYTVTLTVRDDDGGFVERAVVVRVG